MSRAKVQGVGKSKTHRDAKAKDPFAKLRTCHVNGVLVSEMSDEEMAKVSYYMTDEAIAQRNEGKQDSVARVTSDPVSKSIQERGDFRRSAMEPWEAPDPMKELVDAHVPKGMRPKFLAKRRCEKDGTRGFEVVKDDKGDAVRLGGLMLGQMPEEKAQARERAHEKKSQERLDQIYAPFDNVAEEQEAA